MNPKNHVRGATNKIAALIVEAIWRPANKLVEQQANAPKEPATLPRDVTTFSDKEPNDES